MFFSCFLDYDNDCTRGGSHYWPSDLQKYAQKKEIQMLDTFNRFDHRCWWSFKVFLFLTICFPSLCTSRDCGQNLYLQGTFYEHFVEYFNSIDENTELEEMVDNLIYLRQSILIQGYECPSIREMCQHAVEYIMGRRVPIDDPIIEELIQRIEERE